MSAAGPVQLTSHPAGRSLEVPRSSIRTWTPPFDFTGEHYRVTGATVMRPPDPLPGVYFGGSSAAAGPVAARFADTYLTWGEPPAQVAQKLAWMRRQRLSHLSGAANL